MATASSPYFAVQWSLTGKPCFLVVRTAKNRPKLLLVVREIVRPRRSCRSGQSPEACSGPERPIDRASLSVGGAHNGLSENLRRCSRRILSGQSDMTGCRPARVGSERTPWRSIGCIDPRGSPAGGAGSGSWQPCLQVTAKEPSQEAPARKSQTPRSVTGRRILLALALWLCHTQPGHPTGKAEP